MYCKLEQTLTLLENPCGVYLQCLYGVHCLEIPGCSLSVDHFFKLVNLTKCQEEIQSALDKLASGPPLLGAFVPKCKPDGHYEDQQCHEMYCWCVGKNGLKLPGTTVRGPAVCLHRGKKHI